MAFAAFRICQIHPCSEVPFRQVTFPVFLVQTVSGCPCNNVTVPAASVPCKMWIFVVPARC